MKRANANFDRAHDLLSKAKSLLANDRSIIHSFSELEMFRAHASKNKTERDRHISEARNYALKLTGKSAESSHGYSTIVRLELEKFIEVMRRSDSTDEDVALAAKTVEQALTNGLEQFRNDEHLLTAEAEFSRLLNDKTRAMNALQSAYKINSASPYVARALSRLHETRLDFKSAREVLTQSLQLLPGEKGLNAGLARLLDTRFPEEPGAAESAWRRSFTAGDTNYTSQFWYARRLYLNQKFEESRAMFVDLKNARVGRQVKLEIAGWIHEAKRHKIFSGKVDRLEDDYGLVIPDGQSRTIYLSRSEVDAKAWPKLRVGSSVKFRMGFNYMGPTVSLRDCD